MERIRQKIKNGFYNLDEVIQKTAEEIEKEIHAEETLRAIRMGDVYDQYR